MVTLDSQKESFFKFPKKVYADHADYFKLLTDRSLLLIRLDQFKVSAKASNKLISYAETNTRRLSFLENEISPISLNGPNNVNRFCLGKILPLKAILRVYFVFGKILWQFFIAVNGQLLKKYCSHPVTVEAVSFAES